MHCVPRMVPFVSSFSLSSVVSSSFVLFRVLSLSLQVAFWIAATATAAATTAFTDTV